MNTDEPLPPHGIRKSIRVDPWFHPPAECAVRRANKGRCPGSVQAAALQQELQQDMLKALH
jgi:hypothetical protein